MEKRRLCTLIVTAVMGLLVVQSPLRAEQDHFITIDGHRLMDGDEPFRFIGWNIPGLIKHYDGFRMIRPESGYLYDPPDAFEQRDCFETMRALGATVIRFWEVGVAKQSYPDRGLRYPMLITGPGEYDPVIFANLDRAIQLANEYDMRLIVTLLNEHAYWGSVDDFARLYGSNDFYGDPVVREGFKQLLHDIVMRVNTFTGTTYRDDKAILAWEFGNELSDVPAEWDREMVDYLHEIDPNHFVMSFSDASDVIHPHHYPADVGKLPKQATDKPYLVGEFGVRSSVATLTEVLDAIVDRPFISGGLLWSIECHATVGGWRAHALHGGDYNAIQWGTTRDTWADGVATHARSSAFAIRGLATPPLPVPPAPELLPCRDPVPALRWRGSVGARYYTIERSPTADGPWEIVADQVYDDRSYFFHALWSDTAAPIGEQVHYRVRAVNPSGVSAPSNVITVTPLRRQLSDDLEDFSRVDSHTGLAIVQPDNTRNSQEDPSGAYGTGALVYRCEDDLRSFRVTGYRSNKADFAVSGDGETFVPITEVDLQDTNDNNGYGGIWRRCVWQSNAPLPAGARYLKISIDGVHLARVDIRFGGGAPGESLIVDNRDPGCSATAGWRLSDKTDQHWGADYLAIDVDNGQDTVRWTSPITEPGWYTVWTFQIGSNQDFAPDARYRIDHADGSSIVGADLRSGTGWHLLGTFPFRGTAHEEVTLTSDSAGKYIYADAMRFMRVGPLSPERRVQLDVGSSADPDDVVVFIDEPPLSRVGLPAVFHLEPQRDALFRFLLSAVQ